MKKSVVLLGICSSVVTLISMNPSLNTKKGPQPPHGYQGVLRLGRSAPANKAQQDLCTENRIKEILAMLSNKLKQMEKTGTITQSEADKSGSSPAADQGKKRLPTKKVVSEKNGQPVVYEVSSDQSSTRKAIANALEDPNNNVVFTRNDEEVCAVNVLIQLGTNVPTSGTHSSNNNNAQNTSASVNQNTTHLSRSPKLAIAGLLNHSVTCPQGPLAEGR